MKKTYCNPVNLDYRFQQDGRGALEACREGSDPAVIRFRGKYYLLPSKTEGIFVSEDLVEWRFLPCRFFNAEGYGPDLWESRGRLCLTAGAVPTPAFASSDPESGHWEEFGREWNVPDPDYFEDEDGRLYLYGGCSASEPLTVREVDPDSLDALGPEVKIGGLDLKNCGWHRPGANNSADPAEMPDVTRVRRACLPDMPEESWQEGAWMTKHNGRYYLQTSQPCTEFNTYSDDIWSGPTPLGPFEPQADNPFSFKPGGFITGAGHSSTFRDGYGNFLHASTMGVVARHVYERRVGIFPAGFLPDGTMYCRQRFGDYPHYVPDRPLSYADDTFTGWMLLNYRAAVKATSEHPRHPAAFACDENIRSCWVADPADPAPALTVDLGKSSTVTAVQINFAEFDCRRFGMTGDMRVSRYVLETRDSGTETWETVWDASGNEEDKTHPYCQLPVPLARRYWRIRILQAAAGGVAAISGFRIFGDDASGAPERIDRWEVERDAADPCVARLRWRNPANSHGVNIRWGLAPDRLHHCWQCRETETWTLRCLDARRSYCVALEAFGPGGAAPLSRIIRI